MLCSCRDSNINPPVSTTSTDADDSLYLTPMNPYDTYRNCDDVYRGKLIGVNEEHLYQDEFYGLAIITVEVSYTYKGINIPGTTIKDMVFDYIKVQEDGVKGFGLEIGSEYLFMTSNSRGLRSPYQIVKISADNKLEYYHGEGKYSNYSDLIYEMFKLDKLEYKIPKHIFEHQTSGSLNKVTSIDQLFDLSENVYFGEVLERNYQPLTIILHEGTPNKHFTDVVKIKVKVFSSAKGDYGSGEIIEDIVFAINSSHCSCKYDYTDFSLLSSYGGYPGIYFSVKGLIDDEIYYKLLEDERFEIMKCEDNLIRYKSPYEVGN